jgi:hypothetical protein
MKKRILVVMMLVGGVLGLTLVAGPLSGSWSSEITFDQGDLNPLRSLESMLEIEYSLGSFISTSESEFQLFGFIWQGFGLTGTLGAFGVQGDVLFGASTADYIYAQGILSTSMAGIDFALYAAQLSDAVLQGPADGFALRIAGSAGPLDIVSITEMGAQIEDDDDDDFNGITIYHASTGLYRHYVTNPIVVGQGFTGEKLTVSGWSFGCVEDIKSTLYMSCSGFEFIKFELSGIDVGLGWLTLDAELKFEMQAKSLKLTPTLNLGNPACIDVYSAILTDAPDDTLYSGFTSLTGISVYGLGLTFSWQGVTFKSLSVLDTAHYAITTPEYGSVIEEITEALEDGDEVYFEYWELMSIQVEGDGCCGGSYSFLANSYFDKNSTSLFGWGMTHIEVAVPVGPMISLCCEVEVDDDVPGLDHLGFGFKIGW